MMEASFSASALQHTECADIIGVNRMRELVFKEWYPFRVSIQAWNTFDESPGFIRPVLHRADVISTLLYCIRRHSDRDIEELGPIKS